MYAFHFPIHAVDIIVLSLCYLILRDLEINSCLVRDLMILSAINPRVPSLLSEASFSQLAMILDQILLGHYNFCYSDLIHLPKYDGLILSRHKSLKTLTATFININ